jgi:ParB/RepB/Spo0J family partition protein
VDGIAESLASEGFNPEYALLVRPLDGEYQILSGHHRHAAALKAGLDAVPCWVRDMDDDAAYMALVTSNTQGELTPLEIGLHALECVEKGKHGGGLTEYAKAIGKSNASITQSRNAAEVYKSIFTRVKNSMILQKKIVILTKSTRLRRRRGLCLRRRCWAGIGA